MPYFIDYNYTEKSIVVFGVPKDESNDFKTKMGGGLWKNYLDKRDNQTKNGWMFPKTKSSKIEEYFKNKQEVTCNKSATPTKSSGKKEDSEKTSGSTDFVLYTNSDDESKNQESFSTALHFLQSLNSLQSLTNLLNEHLDEIKKSQKNLEVLKLQTEKIIKAISLTQENIFETQSAEDDD